MALTRQVVSSFAENRAHPNSEIRRCLTCGAQSVMTDVDARLFWLFAELWRRNSRSEYSNRGTNGSRQFNDFPIGLSRSVLKQCSFAMVSSTKRHAVPRQGTQKMSSRPSDVVIVNRVQYRKGANLRCSKGDHTIRSRKRNDR